VYFRRYCEENISMSGIYKKIRLGTGLSRFSQDLVAGF